MKQIFLVDDPTGKFKTGTAWRWHNLNYFLITRCSD